MSSWNTSKRSFRRNFFFCFNPYHTHMRLVLLGVFLMFFLSFWIIFSEEGTISFSFQQPTYLLEKDTPNLSTYTCDTSKESCKVNFDFRTSAPDGAKCFIDFWFGETGQENTCNPNTVEFPIGEWMVKLVVKNPDETLLTEWTILIIHPDPSIIDPLTVTHVREWQSPTYLLEKENLELWEYFCDPLEKECKMNLKITPKMSGENSSNLTCEITTDFELVPTTDPCNPNTSIVPEWDHEVTIKILSKATSEVLQTSIFTLKNLPEEPLDPEKISLLLEWQSPTYLIEKDDTSLTEYTCDPLQEECKINLKVTPQIDGENSTKLSCIITSDFEVITSSDPCNPNTSIVPNWDHVISIDLIDVENTVLKNFTLLIKNSPTDNSLDPTRATLDLVFQQPTYFLEKEDTNLSSYTCDSARSQCRANFLLTPKLDGENSSLLTCHITTDFWVMLDTCNPDTIDFPAKVESKITIEIRQKNTENLLLSREITVIGNTLQWSGWWSSSSNSSSGNPLDLSGSFIEVQSGLDDIGMCKNETCQVNFLANVPTGAICFWSFWSGTFETENMDKKCNPGFVKFPFNTTVYLTVSDPSFPENTTTKQIQVLRKELMQNTSSEALRAQIDLQWKVGANKKLTATGIQCLVKKDATCSINFTGEESVGAKSWVWDFWEGTRVEKENPSAHDFPVWNYRVRLVASDGVSTQEAFYDVEVVTEFTLLEEEKTCTDCEKNMGKIHITAVFPNPPHADTVEWIEITNISSETLSLKGCFIADETKKYALSDTFLPESTLRLRQAVTKLSLGNTSDTVTLKCGEYGIDTFSWDFPVPDGYILRREILNNIPQKVMVENTVDGDTIDVILSWEKIRVRLLWVDTPETVHPFKSVEKFWKEASDFTRSELLGREVWITFDSTPVDLYGRRLGYIWLCSREFSESTCTLFNARIVREWYGRMERRFSFLRYADFDLLEKEAKKEKIGIWSDSEVAKIMNELSSEEKELLEEEKEKEYLELQEELLECEEEACEKEDQWKTVTEKMSTLSVSAKKSGRVDISGRTWPDFPLVIEIFQWENAVETFHITSDHVGNYETAWLPRITGDFLARVTFTRDENSTVKEKTFTAENISPHFLSLLEWNIILQGTLSKNRWQEGNTFHCRSRGSCSVNFSAESNRKSDVRYIWELPDGTSEWKNPKAFKVWYGTFFVKLTIQDLITGEEIKQEFRIVHAAIPKSSSSSSKKFTLDLKDVPEDIWGGLGVEEGLSPLQQLALSLSTLSVLWWVAYFVIFRKK